VDNFGNALAYDGSSWSAPTPPEKAKLLVAPL
jgi:hypothetical protein